jgi:hypothetical protein
MFVKAKTVDAATERVYAVCRRINLIEKTHEVEEELKRGK